MTSQRTLLLLTISLVTLNPAFAGPTILQTFFIDTTFRAIGPDGDFTGQGIANVGLDWEAAHTGWNSSLDFDDSDAAGWTNTIAVIHPNEPFIRYWVDGTETVGSSPAYFRKLFTVPGQAIDGALDFGVDDDAQVYINGQLVFNDGNSLATEATDIGITSALKPGLNLIAIKAQDQQGAQSIWGRVDILTATPEPNSLTIAAMILAAALLRHRTRD